MSTHFSNFRSIAASLVVAGLLSLVSGCQSPDATHGGANAAAPAKDSPKPNFGPPVQDVRTEVNLQNAEMEYNAAKNSQPTHQHEAEVEAAKKKAKQDAAAKDAAAKDAAAKDAAPKDPAPKP